MNIASPRSLFRKSALLTLGFALSLAPAALLNAASTEVMQPMTPDKAAALPLTHTFSKVTGDNGPFELKLTNTSHDALKLNVKILLSVYSHASDRAKVLPEHSLAAGKDWTIPHLAALDKVIITAEGHAPLELEVR